MIASFKISTPDGNEHFVYGVDELKRLYREGRIAADILMRPTSSDKWVPLNEMFNLDEWEKPSSKPMPTDYAPPPVVDPAAVYYGPGSFANHAQQTPTMRGTRAAGCLMIGMALINIATVSLRGYRPTSGIFADFGPSFIGFLSLFDVIVGIALLTGRWRRYAIFRVCMGALVLIPQILAFQKHTVKETLTSFFLLVFLGGFIILLSDEFISVARTIVGVGTSVFAQVAVGIIALVFGLPALRHNAVAASMEKQFKPYVIADRHFKDVEAGVVLNIPNPWLLVTNDNPLTKSPNARMVAVDAKDGGYAVLRMEYVEPATGIDSLEAYISDLERRLEDGNPGHKELSRTDVDFGNKAGRRLETAWETSKGKFHGWRSFCRRGDVYYTLSGWCNEAYQADVFPRYKELEQRFTLTTFPDAK